MREKRYSKSRARKPCQELFPAGIGDTAENLHPVLPPRTRRNYNSQASQCVLDRLADNKCQWISLPQKLARQSGRPCSVRLGNRPVDQVVPYCDSHIDR